ncbi:MAG: phosphatase PAP2 family protein [Bacteroidia bacterium]|nr:phosphatase PAP2 family protein [Bacteroidia bacterium]
MPGLTKQLRYFFLGLILLPSWVSGQATGPYHLNLKRQGIILGTGLVLAGGDALLRNHVTSLTSAELNDLDPASVWVFDRSATRHYSTAAAHRSDVGFYGAAGLAVATSFVLPVTHAQGSRSSFLRQAGTLFLLWGETNAITLFGTDVVKNTVMRTRPYAYNPLTPLDAKLEVDTRRSFFSGHTSLTAANTFFAAKVFSDYFPESKWKPVVWTAAAIVPAWVGFERYQAGKHFPSDIIAGYAVGAAMGVLIPHLHLPAGKLSHRGMSFQLYPVALQQASGLGGTLSF